MANVQYQLFLVDYDQLSTVAPEFPGQSAFYVRNGNPCFQNGSGEEQILSTSSSDVQSVNGFQGAVTIAAGSNISIVNSSGTITISSSAGGGGAMNYGNLYGHSISVVVTVAAAENFYQIPSGLTAGQLSNFTLSGSNGLQCGVAGVYTINFALSVMSGTANETLQAAIMVNGTAILLATSETTSSGANHPGCVSATGIVSLSASDIVSLAVMNETAAHDITITQASMTILNMGS